MEGDMDKGVGGGSEEIKQEKEPAMESSVEMGRRVQVQDHGQAPGVKEIWDIV